MDKLYSELMKYYVRLQTEGFNGLLTPEKREMYLDRIREINKELALYSVLRG